MKYTYLLTVHNDETNEKVCQIEALSLGSLEEQLHKVEKSIKEYENKADEEKQELSDCCGAPLDISKAFCSSCGEHV